VISPSGVSRTFDLSFFQNRIPGLQHRVRIQAEEKSILTVAKDLDAPNVWKHSPAVTAFEEVALVHAHLPQLLLSIGVPAKDTDKRTVGEGVHLENSMDIHFGNFQFHAYPRSGKSTPISTEEIIRHTAEYLLRPNIMEHLLECAQFLVAVRRVRINTGRWVAFAQDPLYSCGSHRNSAFSKLYRTTTFCRSALLHHMVLDHGFKYEASEALEDLEEWLDDCVLGSNGASKIWDSKHDKPPLFTEGTQQPLEQRKPLIGEQWDTLSSDQKFLLLRDKEVLFSYGNKQNIKSGSAFVLMDACLRNAIGYR
jgi:hypothetical protein